MRCWRSWRPTSAAFERRCFQLLLQMNAAEFVAFIAGDYAWSLVSDAGRNRIARGTIDLFLDAGACRRTIPLALQQITLVKEANA